MLRFCVRISELTQNQKNPFGDAFILYELCTKTFFGEDRMTSGVNFVMWHQHGSPHQRSKMLRFCVDRISEMEWNQKNPFGDPFKLYKLCTKTFFGDDRMSSRAVMRSAAIQYWAQETEMTLLIDICRFSRLEGFRQHKQHSGIHTVFLVNKLIGK